MPECPWLTVILSIPSLLIYLKAPNSSAASIPPLHPPQEDEAAAAPAEPTWELPEDLREYKGDLGDRKAQSDFRQRQQAEKRRLDKEKDK